MKKIGCGLKSSSRVYSGLATFVSFTVNFNFDCASCRHGFCSELQLTILFLLFQLLPVVFLQIHCSSKNDSIYKCWKWNNCQWESMALIRFPPSNFWAFWAQRFQKQKMQTLSFKALSLFLFLIWFWMRCVCVFIHLQHSKKEGKKNILNFSKLFCESDIVEMIFQQYLVSFFFQSVLQKKVNLR